MNNSTICQYIGCIGGQVTLSLRNWELTSSQCHIRHQLSIWQTSTWLVNGNSYIKIKCWRSNGFLAWIEKSVPWDNCLASLGEASWCQTVTLGRIFLSVPQTHERFLYSSVSVVEKVDNSASLYSQSIQGHHVCLLVKQVRLFLI